MHIHILGICGTFMAGIARLALARGHRVTGADRAAWPPMSTELERLGIPVAPYRMEDLDPSPDLVVIGNALSRGNPVVEAVLDRGLPYVSGPEWLGREVLPGRHVVAVSGTHGKTTTSALVAHVLREAGLRPGWLVGGVAHDLPGSAHAGEGLPFVVEADEYDTAFFDKRSKFLHYRPRTLVVNHLEFDHADIFPDLPAIQTQFHQLVRTVPGQGRILVRAGIPALEETLARGCWSPVLRFAVGEEAGSSAVDLRARLLDADGSRFSVLGPAATADGFEVAWGMRGSHNVANALAAFLVAEGLGVDVPTFMRACASFRGVRRRLESLGTAAGVEVIDDFAHHPTAIETTLAGLAAGASTGRLHAVLELRSNSMRAGEYRDRLAECLRAADAVWVLSPPGLEWDVPASLAPLGGRARCIAEDTALVEAVAAAVRPGDRVVCMSNGDFAGVPGRILAALNGAQVGL